MGFRKIAFALLPALLLFGGTELVLRVAGFEYYGIPTHLQFGPNVGATLEHRVTVPDPELFWRFRVAADTLPGLLERRWVHPELRAATDVDPRDASRLRIVTMGDSCTFFGAPPYSQRLAALLRGAGQAADVWNASVPGYSSHQGRRWLASEVLSYQPDWVTLYYGWNDHWLALEAPDRALAASTTPLSSAVDRLAGHLRVLQVLRALRSGFASPAPAGRPLRVPPADYEDNLRAMCESARAAGAGVLMITAPADLDSADVARLASGGYVAGDTDVTLLHQRYNEITRQVARSCGATLLDLDRLAEADTISEDGIHLTQAGIDLLATAIATTLRRFDLEHAPSPFAETL